MPSTTLEKALEIGFHVSSINTIGGMLCANVYENDYKKFIIFRNITYGSLFIMASSLAAMNIIDILN